MPKLNSYQLKSKRKILDWAGTHWNGLKEYSKVKIWCALLSKEMPSKVEGDFSHSVVMSEITKDSQPLRFDIGDPYFAEAIRRTPEAPSPN